MKFTPKSLMEHASIPYNKDESWKYLNKVEQFCFGKYCLGKAFDGTYFWSKEDVFYLHIDKHGKYKMIHYNSKTKTKTKYFYYLEDALDLLFFKNNKWMLKL